MSDRCQLCEPAPHENCEVYTTITVEDSLKRKDAPVDVCLEHYEAVEEAIRNAE